MGKGRIGRGVTLLAAAILALPFVSCTVSGSGSGEAAKVETGGMYRCECGIPKKVGPGEAVPRCCGKPMKPVAQ